MATQPRKQRRTTSERIDLTKPAAIVINQKFNGLVHFCGLTGYPNSTAYFWMQRGYIPQIYKGQPTYSHILEVAKKAKIALKQTDFLDAA